MKRTVKNILFIVIIALTIIYYKHLNNLTSIDKWLYIALLAIIASVYVLISIKYFYSNIINTILVFSFIISIICIGITLKYNDYNDVVMVEGNSPVLSENNMYKKLTGAIEAEIIEEEILEVDTTIDDKIYHSIAEYNGVKLEIPKNMPNISDKIIYKNHIYVIDYDNLYKLDMDGNLLDVNTSFNIDKSDMESIFISEYDEELYFYNDQYISSVNDKFELTKKIKFDYTFEDIIIQNGYLYTMDYDVLKKYDLEGNLILEVNKSNDLNSQGLYASSVSNGNERFVISEDNIYIYSYYSLDKIKFDSLTEGYNSIARTISIYDFDLNYEKTIVYEIAEDIKYNDWVYTFLDNNATIHEEDEIYYFKTSSYDLSLREIDYDIYVGLNNSRIVSDSIGINDKSQIDSDFSTNLTFTLLLWIIIPSLIAGAYTEIGYLKKKLENYYDEVKQNEKNNSLHKKKIFLLLLQIVLIVFYYLSFGLLPKFAILIVTVVFLILCYIYLKLCIKYFYSIGVSNILINIGIISIITLFIIVSTTYYNGSVVTERSSPILVTDNIYKQYFNSVEAEITKSEFLDESVNIDKKIDKVLSTYSGSYDDSEVISFEGNKAIFNDDIYVSDYIKKNGVVYSYIYRFSNEGEMTDVVEVPSFKNRVRLLNVYENELYFYNDGYINSIDTEFRIETRFKIDTNSFNMSNYEFVMIANSYVYAYEETDDFDYVIRKYDFYGNVLNTKLLDYGIETIFGSEEELYTYKNTGGTQQVMVFDSNLKNKKTIIFNETDPLLIDTMTDSYANISEHDGQYHIYASNFDISIKELGYDVYYNIEATHALSDSIGIKDNSNIDNRFNTNITFTVITILMMPSIILGIVQELLYLTDRIKKYFNGKRSRR